VVEPILASGQLLDFCSWTVTSTSCSSGVEDRLRWLLWPGASMCVWISMAEPSKLLQVHSSAGVDAAYAGPTPALLMTRRLHAHTCRQPPLQAAGTAGSRTG